MRNHASRWAPVVGIIAVAIAAQTVLLTTRYDVSGHAAEHLSSASVPFVGLAAVLLLFVATPRARRQPLVLITATAWLAATALVLVGNLRVVDALVDAGMADTPTSGLVMTASVESAHGLANTAPLFGVAAALALSFALWRHRHVSGRVAVASAVASALFPPWIVPGAGVVVVSAARWVAATRPAPRGTPDGSARSATAPHRATSR